MINVVSDLATSAKSVELAQTFDDVWAVVGVHPHEAKLVDDRVLQTISDLALRPRVVAVGEIGLDFFRDHSPRDVQEQVFRSQLEIAVAHKKPVVLHIRDAYEEAFNVLELADHPEGLIFHCFSAGPKEARRAVELGAYVSFAGNITYSKSESIRQASRQVPQDRLLIETDAPYLAPTPHRGRPNEPAFLPDVGRALAESTGFSTRQIAEVTRANANRVFGLD